MNEKRCTGHCCTDFTLPVSPMQFKWWAKLLRLGKPASHWKRNGPRMTFGGLNRGWVTSYLQDEIAKIADMVIFLREDKHDNALNNRKGNIGTVYHYTCKYHDAKTGDCMNYENRPQMCSSYPNELTCRYRGCTSSCSKKEKLNGPCIQP